MCLERSDNQVVPYISHQYLRYNYFVWPNVVKSSNLIKISFSTNFLPLFDVSKIMIWWHQHETIDDPCQKTTLQMFDRLWIKNLRNSTFPLVNSSFDWKPSYWFFSKESWLYTYNNPIVPFINKNVFHLKRSFARRTAHG